MTRMIDVSDLPTPVVQAIESLVRVYREQAVPPLRIWPLYVRLCRQIATETELDLRTIDRALWAKGKSSNASVYARFTEPVKLSPPSSEQNLGSR